MKRRLTYQRVERVNNRLEKEDNYDITMPPMKKIKKSTEYTITTPFIKDIWAIIALHLDFKSLCNLSKICKQCTSFVIEFHWAKMTMCHYAFHKPIKERKNMQHQLQQQHDIIQNRSITFIKPSAMKAIQNSELFLLNTKQTNNNDNNNNNSTTTIWDTQCVRKPHFYCTDCKRIVKCYKCSDSRNREMKKVKIMKYGFISKTDANNRYLNNKKMGEPISFLRSKMSNKSKS